MSIQRHCAHRKARVQILKCASVTWGKVLDPPESMPLTAKWGPKYCLPQGGIICICTRTWCVLGLALPVTRSPSHSYNSSL